MSDILHHYLDLLRGENENRFGFHNVLNVMKQSRGGYVLNESFDGINLRNEPLVGIHFSDEYGQNASSFRSCNVNRSCFLSGHSAPIESMEFIDDNTLVSRSANEVITWDIWAGIPVETKINIYEEKSNINNYDYNQIYKDINNTVWDSIGNHDFFPIPEIYGDRLVIVKPTSPKNYNGYFVYDLVIKRLFPCVSPNLLKVSDGSLRYLFIGDNNEIFVYDLGHKDTVPVPLNIHFDCKIRKVGNLKNTNCIYIITEKEEQNSYKDTYYSYIIDLDNYNKYIIIKDLFKTPIYISEINCFWFYYPNTNRVELRRKSDFNVVKYFDELNLFRSKSSYIASKNGRIIGSQTILAVSKNKKIIAVSGIDFSIHLFSLESSEHIKMLGGNTAGYKAIVSYDRKKSILYPYTYSNKSNIMWNVIENHIIGCISSQSTDKNYSFSFDSKMLLIYTDTTIDTIKLEHNSLTRSSLITLPDKVASNSKAEVFLDLSSKYIFCITRKNNLLIYDKNGMLILSDIKLISDQTIRKDHVLYPSVCNLKISDNLEYIASCIVYATEEISCITEHNAIEVLNLKTNQIERIEYKGNTAQQGYKKRHTHHSAYLT